MPTSAKYVLDIPKSSLEKHGSEIHSAENLHSINGQTSNVMVVPHNNRLTIAWDCCILQYCLMAHFLKNEFASGLSVMVLRLAPSLKKQSPKKTSGWIKRDYFGRIVWTKETWSGKDEPYTEWAKSMILVKCMRFSNEVASMECFGQHFATMMYSILIED